MGFRVLALLSCFLEGFRLSLFPRCCSFSSFRRRGWRLEVFHFCHCFSAAMFAHFLLLSLSRFFHGFCSFLSPVAVSLSGSGFFLFRRCWPFHVFRDVGSFWGDSDIVDFLPAVVGH